MTGEEDQVGTAGIQVCVSHDKSSFCAKTPSGSDVRTFFHCPAAHGQGIQSQRQHADGGR